LEKGNYININISREDGTAIFMQIVNQVKYLVASGSLVAGDELPTIRDLAEQLVINPNTVAHAYRELQKIGIIDKRGTAGSFISAGGSPLAKTDQIKVLEQRIDVLLSDARNMGISINEVKRLIDKRSKLLK
jgi:GntR family transcriptional regulator